MLTSSNLKNLNRCDTPEIFKSSDTDSESEYMSCFSGLCPQTQLDEHSIRNVLEMNEDQCDVKENLNDEIKIMERNLKRKNRASGRSDKLVYENQESFAMDIVEGFVNPRILVQLAIAPPQWGKTGSMFSVIQQIYVPPENIFIITGHSSIEWKEQTIIRMPPIIQSNVYHRPDLKKFPVAIAGKKNVLIIIDECHIAAKIGQTLATIFKDANLLDYNYLFENDIKILEYSATPNGTLYDHNTWGNTGRKVIVKDFENYIGPIELFSSKRVRQCEDLITKESDESSVDGFIVNETILDQLLETILSFLTKRYHIFRPQVSIFDDLIDSLKDKQFLKTTIVRGDRVLRVKRKQFDIIIYDLKYKLDINELLSQKPEQHTIILLKEKLRCAKTIEKKYLGVLYERFSNKPSDSVIIQGLLGRSCGYDTNEDSIIYTYIPSIETYKNMWTKIFDDISIEWKSDTTKYKRGKTISTGTFIKEKTSKFADEIPHQEPVENTEIITFNNVENMYRYLRDSGRIPRSLESSTKKRGDFYLYRDEIYNEKMVTYYLKSHAGSNGSGKTYAPYYLDINNPMTLRFAVAVLPPDPKTPKINYIKPNEVTKRIYQFEWIVRNI